MIQRVVPHYRVPLFQALFEEYGWYVACAENPPRGTHLALSGEQPWLLRFPFTFFPGDGRRVHVPVGPILKATRAKGVLAEFALGLSSTYQLPLLRRATGARVVFWSHGFNHDRGRSSLRDRWMHRVRMGLAAQVDGHVCYGAEGAREVRRYLPDDRVFVARNTLDVGAIRLHAQNSAGSVAPGRPHLITSGRLTGARRTPLLLEAFRIFLGTHPRATLTIIGDGPERDRTKRAARAMLGRSVRLIGACYSEAELAKEMVTADAFVYAGPIGLSANHALAYGLPVVAFSPVTGIRHKPEGANVVDGITGVLVQPDGAEALAEALIRLFTESPSPRERYRAAIQRYVDQNLLLSHYVEDFGAVHRFLSQ